MMTRAMTARRDGRQMTRIGAGLEELTARADALAAAGPEAAQAALENATTHLILTPGSAMGKATAIQALGGGNRTAEQNGSNSSGELPPAGPRRKPRP